MKNIDIEKWITDSPNDKEKAFRRAIHIILLAISNSPDLRAQMLFHGGLLMALKYKGVRHTTDLDFATKNKFVDVDTNYFLKELEKRLTDASEIPPYGMACKIQSHKIKPLGENKNFQTLEINVGYAYKDGPNYRRLLNKNCTNIIKIDYSYNEINQKIDILEFSKNNNIKAYSLSDFVAEKYRAIIQQKTRNRNRRQDVFDIYWLIKNNLLIGNNIKNRILKSFLIKSASRNLAVNKLILRDEDIIKRSKTEYDSLGQEINIDLPMFKDIYKIVQEYYESMPWKPA
jgi:hypothetical protein